MHETCVLEAFLTNVLELLRKFIQKYISILIGLAETNTAVYIYIYVDYNLIERSEIEFKGLGGARNMCF